MNRRASRLIRHSRRCGDDGLGEDQCGTPGFLHDASWNGPLMTSQRSPGEICEQIADSLNGLRHKYQAAGSAQSSEA
jgi:hypothetical protein